MNPLQLSKRDYRQYVQSQRMFAKRDYICLFHTDRRGNKYETVMKDFVFYWFNRKTITIRGLFRSDGATSAVDLAALAWFLHDWICEHPYFDDGSPISNLLASWMYRSILIWHGITVRSRIRFVFTYLFGGKKIKQQVGWI